MDLIQRVDSALGRLLMRGVAIVAFLVATAAGAFGVIVLLKGHFIGVVILLCGALFVWLGRLAWGDGAGLGEVLNRDFAPAKKGKSDRSVSRERESEDGVPNKTPEHISKGRGRPSNNAQRRR